jgi:endonuclease/exonuclease/phosphatase family metal-dependent hydrolase
MGCELALFGAHPMRPGTPSRMEARAAAFAALAAAARGERHAIVMGDLNATVYSPALADLLETADLADSRRGFGRQGSWIASYPILGRVVAPGVRLDLDHVLVGKGFAVVGRRLGPDLGSDHIPVAADLALRASPAEGEARREPEHER